MSRASTKAKIFICLLVLGFFILPIASAVKDTYSVQKAICRKGVNLPATPTDCTSELNISDDNRFRVDADLTNPAYVNATWNIGLHSDYLIDEVRAMMEWRTNGEAGNEILEWYFYNATSSTYQQTGCPNGTALAKDIDQTDICNVTWIYNRAEDLANINLEAKYYRNGGKKDIFVDYFAINLTYHDGTPPSIFGIIPINNLTLNASTNIEISANATDYQVDKVFAEIIYPNNTINSIELVKYSSTNKYNNTFTIPNLEGRYNITFIANDTYGNINNTEKTWFNLILPSNITPPDTTPPQVWNITPKAGSNFSKDSVVDITANVTDNVAVDRVFANITTPDLSVVFLELFDDDNDDIYNNSIVANQQGWYYVTIIANDTSGNVNNTVTTNFDPAGLGGGSGGGGAAGRSYESIPDWKKFNDVTIIPPKECIESWLCIEWGSCESDGYEKRNCEDYYKCGTEKTKPLTKRECSYDKKPAEESRFAVSLLIPRKQTNTLIASLGILSLIMLLGVSVYLIYRKKKKKSRKNRIIKKINKTRIRFISELKNIYEK